MTMTTRLLETSFDIKFHALQIIFVRMLATAILGSLYMWIKKVPYFPLGEPSVRGLLVLRGFAGFLGLACSYCKHACLLLFECHVCSGWSCSQIRWPTSTYPMPPSSPFSSRP